MCESIKRLITVEWIDQKIDEEMKDIFYCKGDWRDHLKMCEVLRMARKEIENGRTES